MKLEKKNLIVERPYKSVYKTEEGIVKIFATDHPKSAVFNEALNTVKVEETEKRTTTLQLQKTRLFRLGQLLEEHCSLRTEKEKLWKR